MRRALLVGVVAIPVLVPLAAPGGELHSRFELTAAETSVSPASDPDWGWWSAGKYDTWSPSDEGEDGLVEARLVLAGETYATLLVAERYPELAAAASWTDPSSGAALDHALTAELEVYDLALARRVGREDQSGMMAWLGLTLVDVDETRAAPDAAGGAPVESATSRLWGAVAGFEGELSLATRLSAVGRLVVRYARGTREATLRPEVPDPDPGDPVAGTVELSDSTERGMWGGELGLRWAASEWFEVDGGWRYRDWEVDGGPASFDGPFLRVAVVF